MHYNPFSYIRSEKDILKFVTALISNTKGEDTKGGEDFWQKAETLLYCALVGLIHYESAPDERNMNTLVELVNSMEVHEEDESFQNPVDIIFERLENGIPKLDSEGNPVLDNGNVVYIRPPKPEHFAVRQYKKYKLAAGLICSNGLLNRSLFFNGGHGVAAQRTDTILRLTAGKGKDYEQQTKDGGLLPRRARGRGQNRGTGDAASRLRGGKRLRGHCMLSR
jgi:hypothetical protein